MKRWRFSELSLLWKILLSTSVAVTALFAFTGEIVLANINRTMSDSLEEEVRASSAAYRSLLQSRADLLSYVGKIISTMSDVRAAFTTRDEATIKDAAGELWKRVSDLNAIFLVTDPVGRVMASLGGVTRLSRLESLNVVAKANFPTQRPTGSTPFASGFFLQDDELYHVSVTPVYVQSSSGQETLINALVVGYQVDALVAQGLQKATGGSEFLFLTPGRVIASTLNPRATETVRANLRKTREKERVSDGVEEYARFETPLLDITGQEVGKIYILRSFENARHRITGLYTKIVLLWLVAMSAGFLLTYLLARRIVEPVKQLDLAAAEVAHQNYAISVEVHSDDEIGRLARTFNTMCASIRQAREDLIRQERISTIGRLSSSIVHDLRNPLAAIYGGSEMLVDADLPPAHVKRLAGNIYRASRRIQELLQDLLNVSRGKSLQPEPCRLRDVAAAACEALAVAAEAQAVKISMTIPSDIELPLERNRVERTFMHLIGNALEAMPEGGEVRITAALEKGSVVVHVEDNGPGIAPEIRSKLFQPFVTAGKRNGLGLGLALSRQTVLDHGGDMWVDAVDGHGARFSFRLPGAQVAQSQAQAV